MNIKERTISGVAWNLVARLGYQGSQFLISIILARLLEPEDFGAVAMVLVIVNFARLFSEQGFSGALIQKLEITAEHAHSIFWLNVFTGFFFTVVLFFAAPLVAQFYHVPALTGITRVLGWTFFISAFGIVPKALLQKKLAFQKIAIIEISAIAGAGMLAVFLALRGFGVWSLVVNHLTISLLMTLLVWRITGWLPRPVFRWRAVKELFHFSANLIGFNTINFWARNADNLLVGRFIGSAGLGIYNRAYSLMLLPINQISNVLGRVMFPVLSKLQHDPARVKQIYLDAMGAISLIASPVMLGLIVTAEPFILTLYGPKWAAVAPLLQILSAVGLLQAITNPVGWIYMSQGRTDWMFAMGTLNAVGVISGISTGIWLGDVASVAIGYAAANILLFFPMIHVPGKLIEMRFLEVIRRCAGTFSCAVAMAAVLWPLAGLLRPIWPHWAVLVLLVALGAAIYLGLLHLFQVAAFLRVRALLAERLPWLLKREPVVPGA